MNTSKPCFSMWIIIALSLILLFSTVVYANSISTFNELLSKIRTYDYDQSQENLSYLKTFINSALNSAVDLKIFQNSMIAFLESDATFASKQFVCQQLSIIGDEDAVPTLVSMLKDTKTSDIARFALERIPGENVDKALRKELSRTSGLPKIGIINTLGQRRDRKSVKDFGKLLDDTDNQVAEAAIVALGKIADENSAQLLKSVMDKNNEEIRNKALDAYLKCADQMVTDGKGNTASEIYNHVFSQDFPEAIRSATLRGMVTVAGEKGEGIILNVIRDNEEQPVLHSAAILLIQELPKSVKMKDFAAELPQLSKSDKIVLLSVLENRGDASALENVRHVALDEDMDVRNAAYKALAALGNESDIDVFLRAATSGERDEREIARENLYRLQGKNVDQTILSKIPKVDNTIKAELVTCIEHRMIANTAPLLMELAKSSNQKIRAASFKSLAAMAEPKHFPEIIKLLKNATTNPDRKRLERALVAVANKFPNNASPSDKILTELNAMENISAKSSLIKVLGIIGEEHTLPVLQKLLTDKNEDLQTAAIYALSDWPTPATLKDLVDVARSSRNEVHQILALRGYIRLLGLASNRTMDETINNYLLAMKLAQNVQEKRMVLSGLSELRSIRSLEAIVEHLDDNSLRPEAEVAALKLSRPISWDYPDKAKNVLGTLIESTRNEQVRIEAQELLIQLNP